MITIGGILVTVLGSGFALILKKVDKVDFDEFKKEQCDMNKDFWDVINKNSELLIRVDERLKK